MRSDRPQAVALNLPELIAGMGEGARYRAASKADDRTFVNQLVQNGTEWDTPPPGFVFSVTKEGAI